MKYNPIDIVCRLAELTEFNFPLMLYIVEEWLKISEEYKKSEDLEELKDVQKLLCEMIIDDVMENAGYRSDKK